MSLLRRLHRDETGVTLVELAFVIAIFLLMFFALLDFGRLSHNWVMAEKAVQMAARMAAVRPAICPGVPQTNAADDGNEARFGTSCTGGAICVAVNPPPCDGNDAGVNGATVAAIWNRVGPLLSGTDSVTGEPASAANLRFTYSFDPEMNFLGGPYVPVVTVELQNLQFEFASPLLGLARLAGAETDATGDTYDPLTFPPMSVSLPGEDLNVGPAG